jgi:hypothetical protein
MQNTNYRLQPQIFDESVRLYRNTVNGRFRAASISARAVRANPAWAIRLLAHSRACLHWAMPSFLPCLEAAVDGIFRPGGGRSGTGFPRRLGEPAGLQELVTRDWQDRGDGRWGKFDWPMSSFSKPTD